MRQMSRLKERYTEGGGAGADEGVGYPNVMAVPELNKVVVNMGVGEATQNIKLLDAAMDELGRITGQKPVVTRAKKSIAPSSSRQGMPIAATVTLRGDRMYEFLDRLISMCAAARARLPRRAAEGLRRPRQLHAGAEGPAHLPRDRLRARWTSCAA